MQRSTRGSRNEPPILLVKWYDVSKWLLERVESFPKNQRFVFGQRLVDRTLGVMELLVEAAYSPRKADLLARVNRDLEVLRWLIRMATDCQLFTPRQYEYCCMEQRKVTSQSCSARHSRKASCGRANGMTRPLQAWCKGQGRRGLQDRAATHFVARSIKSHAIEAQEGARRFRLLSFAALQYAASSHLHWPGPSDRRPPSPAYAWSAGPLSTS